VVRMQRPAQSGVKAGKSKVFRKLFGLPDSSHLLEDASSSTVADSVTWPGRLYIGNDYVGFLSSAGGTYKVLLHINEISQIESLPESEHCKTALRIHTSKGQIFEFSSLGANK